MLFGGGAKYSCGEDSIFLATKMCERIEINSEQDWQDFLDSATREELEILKEDILSGKACLASQADFDRF